VNSNVDGGTVRRDPRKGSELGKKSRDEVLKKKSRTLRIGFLNCCGIRGKLPEIEEIINKEDFNIIACCETWFRKDDVFGGEIMIRKDDCSTREMDTMNRTQRGKRGMLVLKNREKEDFVWNNLPCNTDEFVHMQLEDLNIVFVYIPPHETKEFIGKLRIHIDEIKTHSKKKIILISDFNADAMKSEDEQNSYNDLEDALSLYEIQRIQFDEKENNAFTYSHKTGTSMLDKVWSTEKKLIKAFISKIETPSDHEMIIAEIIIEDGTVKKRYEDAIRTIYRPSTKQSSNLELKKKLNLCITKNGSNHENLNTAEIYMKLTETLIYACKNVYINTNKKIIIHKQKNLPVCEKVKFWIEVRQKMKQNILRTLDFEGLQTVKLAIRKEIKILKRKMWHEHLEILKAMNYAR
jgi:hypothetical protein